MSVCSSIQVDWSDKEGPIVYLMGLEFHSYWLCYLLVAILVSNNLFLTLSLVMQFGLWPLHFSLIIISSIISSHWSIHRIENLLFIRGWMLMLCKRLKIMCIGGPKMISDGLILRGRSVMDKSVWIFWKLSVKITIFTMAVGQIVVFGGDFSKDCNNTRGWKEKYESVTILKPIWKIGMFSRASNSSDGLIRIWLNLIFNLWDLLIMWIGRGLSDRGLFGRRLVILFDRSLVSRIGRCGVLSGRGLVWIIGRRQILKIGSGLVLIIGRDLDPKLDIGSGLYNGSNKLGMWAYTMGLSEIIWSKFLDHLLIHKWASRWVGFKKKYMACSLVFVWDFRWAALSKKRMVLSLGHFFVENSIWWNKGVFWSFLQYRVKPSLWFFPKHVLDMHFVNPGVCLL